jgi:hypothetical protein
VICLQRVPLPFSFPFFPLGSSVSSLRIRSGIKPQTALIGGWV